MIRNLLKATVAYDLYIALRARGFRRSGWFRSLRARQPVDHQGDPLPWYTYAAIHFLEPRVQAAWRVFEFGCGNSTLWWASRAGSVRAVEHDAAWHRRMVARAPSNATLVHQPLRGGRYAEEVLTDSGRYDVVVIDGRLRNACAAPALAALNDRGVVVWDNAERPQYRRGLALLLSSGFRRLDFFGPAPGSDIWWVTAVLYRSQNCLGI